MNLLEVCRQLRQETNKNTVVRLIRENGTRCDCILKEIPAFQHDRDVVKCALEYDARSIYYASDALKNDYELAMYVVRMKPLAFYCLGSEIRKNMDVICSAAKHDWTVLRFVDESLLDDPILVDILKEHGLTREDL